MTSIDQTSSTMHDSVAKMCQIKKLLDAEEQLREMIV